mgnify:CR=1 FL=1
MTSEIERLVPAMLAGVRSDPPWQELVSQLRLSFGATHANIVFRHPALEISAISEDTSGESTKLGDAHARYVPSEDPISYFEMKPFKAYSVDDFVAQSEIDRHPFLQEFLIPLEMGSVLICRVVAERGFQAWISVARQRSQSFTAEEAKRLESLSGIFREALALFGSLKEIESQRDSYQRLARAKATGILQIDYTGQILHVDESTEAWIQGQGLLRISGKRLLATSSSDRVRLDRAMSRILGGSSEEELISLEGPEGDGVELLLLRTSGPFEPVRANALRALIYLHAAGHETAPSAQRLQHLFALSPREAALACVLVKGLTVAEAALDLGISEQTARSYLRQVFEKTGVTRQADLIRKLQPSVASIN